MRALDVATRLPDPDALERLSVSVAALDVALSPEWESRYFSFDPLWTARERMASMRNGSGDAWRLGWGVNEVPVFRLKAAGGYLDLLVTSGF